MIIDVTCSAKRRWPVYADLRLDISPEARPDIIADCRHLPFLAQSVDEIWCDPPHLVKSYRNKSPLVDSETYFSLKNNATKKATDGYRRFKIWGSMAEYLSWLDECVVEFNRVLKPYGILRYKTTDGSRSHGTTIRVSDAKDRFGSVFRLVLDDAAVSKGYFARYHAAKHGTVTLTHYLTFQKRGK